MNNFVTNYASVLNFVKKSNPAAQNLSELKILHEFLIQDERLHYIAGGNLEKIHTKDINGTGIIVLTTLRVLFLRKSFLGSVTSEELLYKNITGSSYRKSLLGLGEIHITVGNNSASVTMMQLSDAIKVNQLITEILNKKDDIKKQIETFVTPKSEESPFDKIEKAYELFQKGILTQDEFLEQKKKLLNE